MSVEKAPGVWLSWGGLGVSFASPVEALQALGVLVALIASALTIVEKIRSWRKK